MRSIASLKRQAKALKKQLGCSHSAALDVAARKEGFGNWSLLANHRSEESNGIQDQRVRSRKAIEAVMKAELYLTTFGLGIFWNPNATSAERRARLAKQRNDMLADDFVAQFERCCRWLNLVYRRKTINKRLGTSYSLKHRVETHFRRHHPGEDYYVSNGMFIAAALHLGFRMQRDGDSPNPWFNISSRALPT